MEFEATLALFLQQHFLHIALLLFVATAAWEIACPARPQYASIVKRWFQNFGIMFLNLLLLRWIRPVILAAVAGWAARLGLGFFSTVELPFTLVLVLSLTLLDLTQYLLHRLLHACAATWRFHRVHHSDLEFDLSTGFRFHPLEAIVTTVAQLAAIAALGIPAVVVMVHGILVIQLDLFTHGNIRIPARLERALRMIFVTPDMHAVHHSASVVDSNSNYGSWLSIWDRLFGTYRARADAAWTDNRFGISEYRDARSVGFLRMLMMPLTASHSSTNPAPLRDIS